MRRRPTRTQFDWALYDWANSAFATTVMAGFFPLFFKQYWSAGVPVTTSTFWLGFGNSAASLIVLVLAPLIGAIADRHGTHRRQLGLFALAGILATASFFVVGEGGWPMAITLYAIAIVGFSGANVFYDAMLPEISSPAERHRVSALGYALGYLGGGLLFLVNVAMTLKPGAFGLADTGEAVRWSFLSVAVWWAVFMLPLLLDGRRGPKVDVARKADGEADRKVDPEADPGVFRGLLRTLRDIRAQPNLWLFLVAYWLYIDGVATIIRMAVDYGMSIGLESTDLIKALLLVQFIGFPATLAFGRIGDRFGAKRALAGAIGVYLVATVCAVFMSSAPEFYALAATLGLVQGGVQSLSRSMFSRLIPPERSGEYFGFLNMLGKAAAVVGPVMVGTVAWATDSPRLGILSVVLLFGGGLWLLLKVEEPAGGATERPAVRPGDAHGGAA